MKAIPLIIYLLFLLQIISPVVAIQYIQPTTYPQTTLHNTKPLAEKPTTSQPANITYQYGNGELPVGIATYGSNPNGFSGSPYIIETTQWLGIVTIDSLSATSNDQNCPYSVGFQLNVVLNYEYNGNTYALWVQDVADYNTQNHEIYIVDNIWNSSTLYANVTGVHGNGSIYDATVNGHPVTFYAYASSSSYTTLSLPATIYLLVNVTTNSQGQPVIYFWYSYGSGWFNYDVVTVTNVVSASNVYFLVQPGETPGDIYYDAALIIGGPGNGTNAQINSGTVYFQLFYWNGHNFQEPLNAYSIGYDTAETISNANSQLYVDSSNGELYAKLVAGTSPSLETLWDQSSVVQLTVYSPVNTGSIYLYNYSLIYPQATQSAYKVPFVGGQATVTLYPMQYAILVYQNGNPVAEANIYGSAGQSVSTDTTQFSISLNETQIDLYVDENGTAGITINAYGNVTIKVISPSTIKTSFTQETVYVDGIKTVDLTITPTQAGTYTITVNASIFPGFYVTQNLTVIVKIPIYDVTFKYNVIGQQIPQQPQVTLQFPNGTTSTITISNSETIKVPAGTVYSFQQIISQGGNTRWATQTLITGVIKENNSVVSATYYEQYLVDFEYQVTNGQWNSTPPTVVYYNFTSKTTVSLPTQVWVNYNSTYYYQNVTVNNERIITTNYKGVITSPGTITVDYILQYYVTVNSQTPVAYAIVNGKNVTLTSNWFNASTKIQVENITYYPSTNERYIITSILPSANITVNSPITIQINTTKQFYVTVTVSSPITATIYAMINGKNESLNSGWYNSGTTIQVENFTKYVGNGERYTIDSVSPSSTVTVNSPTTISITVVEQFYVTVNSPIPVKALVNGMQITFNTGWYDANSSIQIENITYYPSPDVRYIIVSVSPSTTIDLTSPITVNITAVKQYYVTVNSQIPVYALINGKNETLTSNWFNANITIYIENITYYQSQDVRYVITSISPSATITVNSPITIQINAVEQFYVTVKTPMPVYAIINGVNETLKSNWYNANTTIQVENATYYTSNDTRYTIVSVLPSEKITVDSPIIIVVKIAEQFYVTVNSKVPIYALINGENETLRSGWYNANTTIYIENVSYYIAKDIRYIIVGIQPSQNVVITSPIAIQINTVEQYYITVNSPIPVYALINGKNESLISSWYNINTTIEVENIPYYPAQGVRYVISSVSSSTNVTVNSPMTIQINVQKQYYVNLVSPYPVYALINGVNGTLKSGWYNANTTIYIKNVTNYPANGVRSFILSVEPSMNITVNSPITMEIKMEIQYYVTVNSKIPVYAFIDGVNGTLKSGWYNANTSIYIENITYYPAPNIRYLILSFQPSQKLVLTSPITVNITDVKQYYVTVNSQIPVYALINGKNESLTNNWYNANSLIQVENISYYISKDVRYVISSVSPSETINLTSPITISVSIIKQFYVTVNSQIPVKAIMNGTMTYLNSSWINEGTAIQVINYTYSVNGGRYIITGISLQSFTVNSSVTVNVSTVKQFLVTINGEQEWTTQGEKITLTANVPIYDVGEFVGTYNVSPGTTITANSSITETLVLHPNYVFYGEVAGIIIVVVTLAVLLTRRGKKGS